MESIHVNFHKEILQTMGFTDENVKRFFCYTLYIRISVICILLQKFNENVENQDLYRKKYDFEKNLNLFFYFLI